jgi:exosortase/archaeosortase family protein
MLFSIKQGLANVPAPTRVFLKRAAAIITIWELIYQFWLKPIRVPDQWLTGITAKMTAWCISLLYLPAYVANQMEKDKVFIKGREVLFIADGCNGLELFLLYIAFIACYPYGSKPRAAVYMVCGVVAIFVMNVGRCTALAMLNIKAPELTDFAHHYAFTVIVYSCIFFGWMKYANFRSTQGDA